MTLADLMRTEVVTVRPSTPVDVVATELRDAIVGSAVVVDSDENPVGIVTDRDIATRVVPDNLDATVLTAEDIMTSDPETADVSMGVMELALLMREHDIRRVPVVDGDTLAGIVTFDDLLILLTGELEGLANVVAAESPPY